MATSRRLLAKTVAAQLVAQPTQQAAILRAAAAYLIEHKLAKTTDLFINDLAHELFIQTGQMTAEVVTAQPLSAAGLAKLKRVLQTATAATSVTVQTSQDASLLGGFIARTADAAIDKSVRQQLSQLRGIA